LKKRKLLKVITMETLIRLANTVQGATDCSMGQAARALEMCNMDVDAAIELVKRFSKPARRRSVLPPSIEGLSALYPCEIERPSDYFKRVRIVQERTAASPRLARGALKMCMYNVGEAIELLY
jgi:hypothetical protein